MGDHCDEKQWLVWGMEQILARESCCVEKWLLDVR
jgi:hypothetical protein